jgi:hypothetical protein
VDDGCASSKIYRISESVHPQQSNLPAATLYGPILNVAVATTNMSTMTMTVIWFRKKLRRSRLVSASLSRPYSLLGLIGELGQLILLRLSRHDGEIPGANDF